MADEGMTPYEIGEALYYLQKYGELPQAKNIPRRKTEVRTIQRRYTDGTVETFEHKVIEDY